MRCVLPSKGPRGGRRVGGERSRLGLCCILLTAALLHLSGGDGAVGELSCGSLFCSMRAGALQHFTFTILQMITAPCSCLMKDAVLTNAAGGKMHDDFRRAVTVTDEQQ